MNGIVGKVGIGNIVTWVIVIGGFVVNQQLLKAEFQHHVDTTTLHLNVRQAYWLEYLESEGFPLTPDLKKSIQAHLDEFEKGKAEGRWEHPAEKKERIRKIVEDQIRERRVQ